MSVSSNDSIFSLNTLKITVPIGATLAVLIDGEAGQNSTILKYFSGGTLEMIGVTAGTTMTAAQLATASGSHYTFGINEIFTIDGPVRFYLSSTGATTIVMRAAGKTQGV